MTLSCGIILSTSTNEAIAPQLKGAQTMSNAGILLNQIEESGGFFDVQEESVVTGSGTVVPGKKVITRLDDGTPLGIVSSKYRTVTNAEIFDKFGQALDASGIGMEGATASVDFSNNGARTMVKMRFPEHEINIGKDNSILEIVCKNSYDGRWNYSVRGGACRMACLNGMLLGDWVASYSEYHNAKLSVSHAADKVVTILDTFQNTEGAWEAMINTPLKDETAWRVLCTYTNRKDDFKRGLSAQKEATRVNTATKLYEQWETREKKEIGPNVFSIYNTMTHHATHGKLRDDKRAIGADLRTGQVQSVLASKYWNERVIGKAA